MIRGFPRPIFVALKLNSNFWSWSSSLFQCWFLSTNTVFFLLLVCSFACHTSSFWIGCENVTIMLQPLLKCAPGVMLNLPIRPLFHWCSMIEPASSKQTVLTASKGRRRNAILPHLDVMDLIKRNPNQRSRFLLSHPKKHLGSECAGVFVERTYNCHL